VEPGSNEAEDDAKAIDFKEEFEVLAKLDDEWKEYFHQNQSARYYSADDDAKRQFSLWIRSPNRPPCRITCSTSFPWPA
jgi:hypothetical protein